MTETATFVCSICNEPSTVICVYCTKDACRNHRCLRCLRCSDCCECEVPLTAPEPVSVWVPEAAPPEASPEPDMNIPAAGVIERAVEIDETESEAERTPDPEPAA